MRTWRCLCRSVYERIAWSWLSDHRLSVMHLSKVNILNQKELITLSLRKFRDRRQRFYWILSGCQVDSPIDTSWLWNSVVYRRDSNGFFFSRFFLSSLVVDHWITGDLVWIWILYNRTFCLRTQLCVKISFPCKRLFLAQWTCVNLFFFIGSAWFKFLRGERGTNMRRIFFQNYAAPLETQMPHRRWGGHPCVHGWRVDSRITSGSALCPDPFEQFFDSVMVSIIVIFQEF